MNDGMNDGMDENPTRFDGKVALVTGGGSGIGRASALALAGLGARVVVCDVDDAGAKETAQSVEAAGGEAVVLGADVTVESEVADLMAEIVRTFGALHCAHNNAGIAGPLTFTADLDADTFRRIIDVNLTGVFLCMKHEIRAMLAAGGGAIVNTSSGAGLGGVPALPGYAASKHGVIGLTRSAAAEYSRQGVRVNAVCPGPIHTPMLDAVMGQVPGMEKAFTSGVPMGRIGTPAEVAHLVAWLLSDAASYVTGAAVSVDGGAMAV